MITWLILSIVLFLTGAAYLAIHGQYFFAKIGVAGVLAAVAMIVAFGG